MNKAELVAQIATITGVPQKQVDAILTSGLEVITDAVSSGEGVRIVGFGSFEVKERSARININPQISEKIEIPAKKILSFSAGKEFRVRVRGEADSSEAAA